MNIRKIAKWFGLKWSNRLEALMPRFERDLLVLSNRTINNSDVAFDDKINALDNMRTLFENPKYFEGLFRVYATYQLFSRMTDSLNELAAKNMPISETFRDIISEFALLRPVNPENEAAAKQLVKVFKKLSDHPIALAKEDGERAVSLETFLIQLKPETDDDWLKFTGRLAIGEQHGILLDLYHYMKKNNIRIALDSYDRMLRACVFLEDGPSGLIVLKDAVNEEKNLSQTQLLKLSTLLSLSQKVELASLIKIEKYRKQDPNLLKFLLRHQETNNLKSSKIFEDIKSSSSLSPETLASKYAILLDGLSIKGDVDGAEALWLDMLQKKIRPNVAAYHAMMVAYASIGQGYKVIDIWHSIPNKQPNRCGYLIGTLITACGKNTDPATLKDVWAKVKIFDYRLDTPQFHAYIVALVVQKCYAEAVEVYSKDLCLYQIVKPDEKSLPFLMKSIKDASDEVLSSDTKEQLIEKLTHASINYRKATMTPTFT